MEQKKALILVHIPKTAGTSIASSYYGQDVLAKSHDIRNPEFKHLHELSDSIFDKIDFFAVVRNPWDRFLSSFTYLQSGGMNHMDRSDAGKLGIHENISFSEFVQRVIGREELLRQMHFIPQHKWITNLKDELLVKHIIKFESLEPDLNTLLLSYGKQPTYLPRLNRSNHHAYKKYYDQKTVNLVADSYAEDIRLFNYDF